MYPLCWILSARYVESIVIRNDRKNGGAVRPWEWIAVNPISCSIVGRKTITEVMNKAAILNRIVGLPGRDEKATLVLKYISFKGVSKMCKARTSNLNTQHDTRQFRLDRGSILTAVTQHLASSRAAPISFHTMPPTLFRSPTCLTPLAFATSLSWSFKKRALSGESGKNMKAIAAIRIVGSPSTRNSNRQFANLEWPEVIPYANAPSLD